MLFIILAILLTIIVIKVGRRFSWSPAHILRLDDYGWLDDIFNWTILQYDWSKLSCLISESVQEQFKMRAPPGWTLKLEGPPSFCTNLPNITNSPSNLEVSSNIDLRRKELIIHKQDERVFNASKSTDIPNGAKRNLLNTLKSSYGSYPISVRRVQTVSKSSQEVVLVFDVKVTNLSQEVFITSRQTNQLESSKCRLQLVKLTGQVKVRIGNITNETSVDASVCFSGTPSINITIPRASFQKDETMLTLEKLLKESIGNVNIKLPLFEKNNYEKSARNSDERLISIYNSASLLETPRSEVMRIDGPPNKLNIKVLKANSLYEKAGNHEVYCSVSVDSPIQTQKTSSVADSPNPFFDELLIFDLDGTTKKVSIVVHDKSNSEAPLGKAELVLREVSNEGLSEKAMRVVLPLMTHQSTSRMSLTVEVSSATIGSNRSAGHFHKHDANEKTHVKNIQMTNLNSTLSPSMNVENLPTITHQISDRAITLKKSQWRSSNSQTDSNLSLVSQASLMVRNNSNESATPKGGSKHRSLFDAVKKRFRRKRSRSEELRKNPNETTDAKIFSDGIYLTPPPKRIPTPGHVEHWSLSSCTLTPSETSPLKKRGKMSSFKNLFRKKNQTPIIVIQNK